MIPISDFFLAETPAIAVGETGNPQGEKTTPTDVRVPLNELELSYGNNPTIFNGINKIVQTIMSAHHEIVCEDESVKKFFDDFTKNLGSYGSDLTWEELLTSMFRHQCVYGRQFIENIFNKNRNRVVDWDIIDPKTMDYAKNSQQKIVTDDYGNPVGYFQIANDMSNDRWAVESKKMLPATVVRPMASGSGKSVFFRPEQVAQIKLYTVGDGFYPVGLIEPIYKTSLRKMNIEEGLANAIYRHGFPIIWAQLGDMNHEPTPQQINTMLTKLKDINFKQEIATPYYYNLHIMESKKIEKMREDLDYFNNQEVTGLGIPKPIALGSAEGSSFATLGIQTAAFELTLRDIINNTCTAIQKYMFAPVCKYEEFTTVPKLHWDIVGINEIDNKAKRIIEYVKAGILLPDEKISGMIKKVEGLE